MKKFNRVLSNNDVADILVCRDEYSSPFKTFIHNKKIPDMRANFAMLCIERWALVAAESDDEDSAGRQKVRRMAPGELVDHACTVSELAFVEFERRGWILDVSSFNDISDKLKDMENNND